MYISRKHELVFLPIPKNASRTIGKLFKDHLQGDTENTLHHQIVPPPGDIKHYTPFVIVRNPYSRVVSKWWGTLTVLMKKFNLQDVDRQTRRKSFKAYIQQLKPGDWGTEYNTINLATQASIVDRAQYYFSNPIRVLKLENLDNEWSALANDLGLGRLLLKKKKIGNGSHEYGRRQNYYRHPWMSRKVHDCFREDFKRFEYSRQIE